MILKKGMSSSGTLLRVCSVDKVVDEVSKHTYCIATSSCAIAWRPPHRVFVRTTLNIWACMHSEVTLFVFA